MDVQPITDRYEPLDRKAKIAIAFLAASVFLAGLAIVSSLAEYSLLSQAAAGEPISREAATASDNRQMVIGIVQAVLFMRASRHRERCRRFRGWCLVITRCEQCLR